MPLQPSNRRLGPLDSRFDPGRYLGLMDGSNTVLVGTASGVVKVEPSNGYRQTNDGPAACRTKLKAANYHQTHWTMLATESGSERLCWQPHAAIPLPPFAPEFRQVRRAPLRKTDFEQFGYTDNCPGCANARAGRKQAVDHSEQCRSRVERNLATTTEGHERLERARDRFAQAAKEPGVDEPQRKRHRLVGEGGSLLRHQFQVTTRKGAAVAVVRYRLRQHHRHSNRHLQNGIWNKRPK